MHGSFTSQVLFIKSRGGTRRKFIKKIIFTVLGQIVRPLIASSLVWSIADSKLADSFYSAPAVYSRCYLCHSSSNLPSLAIITLPLRANSYQKLSAKSQTQHRFTLSSWLQKSKHWQTIEAKIFHLHQWIYCYDSENKCTCVMHGWLCVYGVYAASNIFCNP